MQNKICINMKRDSNIKITEEIKNKGKKKNIISEVFSDYCSSTSIHGIGYLGAADKSFPEKIWWIIVFFMSVIACFYLITKTWIKWQNNPVILSFEKEQIPIWKIPFPAVTVCPVNKVLQNQYNYTEKFRNRNNLSEEDYKEFWDISLVCNLEKYLYDFNCTFNVTDENAMTNIIKYAPKSYLIYEESFQGIYDRFFEDQITEEGLCFTFNSLSQESMFTKQINITYIYHAINNSGWTIEDGYQNDIRYSDYPFRTSKDGIASGLSFLIETNLTQVDYVCGMSISGFKIILHNPAELPKAAEQYFLAPLKKKVNLIVKPELTKTSKSLLSLPAHTRKCYFSHEKSLKFFTVYNQNNCRRECDANISLHFCDCAAFYMPRNDNTSVCGYAKMTCVKEIERTILMMEMLEKKTNTLNEITEKLNHTRQIYEQCDCLPSCTNLQYSAEISHSDYYLVKTFLASGMIDKNVQQSMLEDLQNDIVGLTQVDIFFKEAQFFALERSELYGRVDFLANCGGLLGLFMGFSILSLLEIIYFLTIRIWFKYSKKK